MNRNQQHANYIKNADTFITSTPETMGENPLLVDLAELGVPVYGVTEFIKTIRIGMTTQAYRVIEIHCPMFIDMRQLREHLILAGYKKWALAVITFEPPTGDAIVSLRYTIEV